MVAAVRPDVVVHTAYVQSDWHVTATGSAHLAAAAERVGARVVLVSSDVVFSGADGLYAESAPPDPVSPYGAAKAAAETVVLAVCADAVVARTSLILGDGRSQHEDLFRDLAAGADGVLFEDERRCPVHVSDLAAALVELAGTDLTGVLHVGGADAMSRHDLGRLVALREGLDASRLRAGSRAALGVPGPVDVRLDSSLAARVLETRLRGAREFLS
jgi:dTDP-4-dehydrorhamnose reductase